jgi:hypothetical protein
MAYSNTMLKGRIGYNNYGWPLIVMERAKSDKAGTPVLCEVYGLEHECGSVYNHQIRLTDNLPAWEDSLRVLGHNPKDMYFKGKLLLK